MAVGSEFGQGISETVRYCLRKVWMIFQGSSGVVFTFVRCEKDKLDVREILLKEPFKEP